MAFVQFLRDLYRTLIAQSRDKIEEKLRLYNEIKRSPEQFIQDEFTTEMRKVDQAFVEHRDILEKFYLSQYEKLEKERDRCLANQRNMRLSHDAYEEAKILYEESKLEVLSRDFEQLTRRQNLEKLDQLEIDLKRRNEELEKSMVKFQDALLMDLKINYKKYDHILNGDLFHGLIWTTFRDHTIQLPFSDSSIADIKDEQAYYTIASLFKFKYSDQFELVYRRSRDGKNVGKDILPKVAQRSNTLTIVQTECGRTFLSYTDVPWSDRWQEGSDKTGLGSFDSVSPFRSKPVSVTTSFACRCIENGLVHKHSGLFFYVHNSGVFTFMALQEDVCCFFRRANEWNNKDIDVLTQYEGNVKELKENDEMFIGFDHEDYPIEEVEIYERRSVTL